MKKYMHWIILGALLATVVALRALASSAEKTTMTPRASEEWSRGQFVGHTPVKQPVALQPALDSGVFLVWPNLDGQLELARVGVDGEVLLDRVIPVEAEKARDPQLVMGLEGHLHLLWREQRGPRPGVCYVPLETDGTPVNQPQVLSDYESGKGQVQGAPRLAQDAQGRLHALWADGAGIHWAVLEEKVLDGPTLLIPDGHSLLTQSDGEGRLHLVWQREKRVNVRTAYYAVLDLEKDKLSDATEIAEIVVNDRLQLEDVAFGLDENTGYLFWSGYDEGFDRYIFPYASFSLDVPQQSQTGLWHLKIGDGPTAIALPDGQHTPLPMALSERVIGLEPTIGSELAHYLIRNEGVAASDQELTLQVTLLTLGTEQDDAVEQVVTASPEASMKPVMAIDDRSHLHLAWLETGGFGQYRLIYASTAPKVLEKYNALTLLDVLDIVLSKLFRLSLVVVTAVLTFIMWTIVPLLGLVVYHLLTSEETLGTVRSRVVLVAALAVEVGLTFALPPRISGVETTLLALRWGVPSFAAVAAAAVTATVARRRGDAHLFATFFLFAALNNLLQMGLYLLF